MFGNNIAGSQMGVMPNVVEMPVENQTTYLLKDAFPGIFLIV